MDIGTISSSQYAVMAAFIAPIIYLFILDCINLKKDTFKSYYNHLTSMGLLGTFVGIAIALLCFDSDDIQHSIPALLAAMRTAFITSVAGLVFSLIFKLCVLPRRFVDTSIEDSALDYLNEISTTLSLVLNGIVDDTDYSLSSQVKNMRTEMRDALNDTRQDLHDIRHDLHEFVSNLAEQGTETLIKALEEVIKDFNAKINAQFGENFKRLNHAVELLVEWQENNKQDMQLLIELLQSTQESLRQSEVALHGMVDESKRLIEVADNIRLLTESFEDNLKKLDEQYNYMYHSLDALASLRDKASSALPEIRSALDEMTTQMRVTVDGALASSKNTVKIMESEFESLIAQARHSAKQLADEVERSLQEIVLKQTENIVRLMNESTEEIDNQQKRSIESLGSALLTISNRFAEDYTPLADKLRKVIEMAEVGKSK